MKLPKSVFSRRLNDVIMPRPIRRLRGARARMHAAKYREIVAFDESCREPLGDHQCGVDWPNLHDASKCYRVMLELIRPDANTPISLLGCGAAHRYDVIHRNGPRGIDFADLDLSRKFYGLYEYTTYVYT